MENKKCSKPPASYNKDYDKDCVRTIYPVGGSDNLRSELGVPYVPKKYSLYEQWVAKELLGDSQPSNSLAWGTMRGTALLGH